MSQPPGQQRYVLGIVILLLVVVIWIASSFTLNSVLDEQSYNKPFLVTYINTTTFILYLLPSLVCKRKKKLESEEYTVIGIHSDHDSVEVLDKPTLANTTQFSHKEIAKLSLSFCFLWFCANYTNNSSLAYTSVSSNTILSSTSGLFTLAISSFYGVEKLTWTKCIAVCTSFLGAVFISYADQSSQVAIENPFSLVGDLLAVMGALFYGIYTVFLKVKIGDESRVKMSLFFGYVGLFNFTIVWPIFFLLHWLNIETFQLPLNARLWAMVLVNAFVGSFLADYLWFLALFMTSPMVVTLGGSLTMPLALIGDFIFHHEIPSLQYGFGAVLVLAGFFIINASAYLHLQQKIPSTSASASAIIQEQEDRDEDSDHLLSAF
ncbi:hypothetical protein BDF14DRAFT_1731481 [Spinellus fusiger]|nr:hypothetical protein BDF14DRAFT_1731481 [Spinellus fusiger]